MLYECIYAYGGVCWTPVDAGDEGLPGKIETPGAQNPGPEIRHV